MPATPPSSAKLQPGYGFHLQPSGSWKVEQIPPSVLESTMPSGYLTIQGYRSTVFETPDGDSWAQKSTGTASSRQAADGEGEEFSASPNDIIFVKAVDSDTFHVKGKLDGTPIAGVAKTTRGAGLGYVPDKGTSKLTDSQYDTLTKIMNDVDPSWGDIEEKENMNPVQIASTLRHIASAIDASESPSRELVARDLKKVLAAIETQALPQSNTGKDMLKKLLSDASEALESGNDGAFKSILEKLSKNS